mgnify:CR=1 FL=1
MVSVNTSCNFISIFAKGTDWRDISKAALEAFDSLSTDNKKFNIGFLYVSDVLSDDLNSILNLFKSVTRIQNWTGCVAVGVIANGEMCFAEPGLAVMVGSIDEDNFKIFQSQGTGEHGLDYVLSEWSSESEPFLTLVHGDPMSQIDPGHSLTQVEQKIQGFLVGGLSSSRFENFQIANGIVQNDISGVVFNHNVKAMTALSQGCRPIAESHTVTRCVDNKIIELDDQKAFDVFTNDLKNMAVEKIGKNADRLITETRDIENPDDFPEELKNLFRGEIHMAFPVIGSDQQDYLVRNILGIDPENGFIATPHNIVKGDRVVFVQRDQKTVSEDLCKSLLTLRERVLKENDGKIPQAAIYVSCVARASQPGAGFISGEEESEETSVQSELACIREILGEIPMIGFYASGEISNAKLYGYTGVIILFL